MNKEDILKILEGAKDKNGDIPMRLVRQAFEKLSEQCVDAVSKTDVINLIAKHHRAFDNDLLEVIEYVRQLPFVTPKLPPGRYVNVDQILDVHCFNEEDEEWSIQKMSIEDILCPCDDKEGEKK